VARIYTGLAAWNLLFLANAFTLGCLRGHVVEPRIHLLSGLFAAIFCCLVHAIVFAHFIGSGKWIKKGAYAAELPDAEAIVKRTKRFKGKTFPFALFSMLFAVATAVLGGGADQKSVSPVVHLVLAILTLAMNVLALFFERSAILENGRIIARVSEANRARVEAGIQPALLPEATMESVRAGSKVFLFLAANVWFLYAYRVFVVRRHDEPVVPYVVACAALAWIGLRMRRQEREGDAV
jgi:hypothetical protein